MTAKHKHVFDNQYVAMHERIVEQATVPGSEAYEPYLAEMGIKPHDTVLDLGVGYGRLLPSIRRHTDGVVGVDLSSAMLGRAKASDPEARLTAGDACLLPFRAQAFDHIVAWAIWENIPNASTAIREVGRVLRPGGRWLVSGKHLLNWRCLRLVYYRHKRAALRRLWPENAARPVARRVLPERIVGKLGNLWPDRDIPQYPTVLPVFRRQLRAAGLTLTRLDRFAGGQLTSEERLSDGSPFFYYFVAMARKD